MAPPVFPLTGKRIWIAGDRGMIGSALVRRLRTEPCEILTASRQEVDLADAGQVDRFLADAKPDAIILAAAKVGGILANDSQPADFLYENLVIETNVIGSAARLGVAKLIFLGSSCIYPRDAAQPISEASLLTGPLEATNEWYAIAKIAGIKLCQAFRKQHGLDFISCMPTNLYGPNDNFDAYSAHVLAAFIARAHAAKLQGSDRFDVWGSGTPLREFLHVDDCADAIVFLLQHYSGADPVNIGSGEEISIAGLAREVMNVAGLTCALAFDAAKPDGMPRKLLDSSRLAAMGWRPKIALRDGLQSAYAWYVANRESLPKKRGGAGA